MSGAIYLVVDDELSTYRYSSGGGVSKRCMVSVISLGASLELLISRVCEVR